MFHHLGDGAVVGNYKAIPLPLLAQHIVDKPAVGCGRGVIYDIKRCHERASPCLGGCLVGWEELVVHAYVTHIYGVVVATGFGTAVQGVVLYAGHHVLRTIVALIAAYQCLGNA